MIATQEEMVEAKVPLAYRDQCAHLLIPLNKCRQAEFYLSWKCENERHSYEKCEYDVRCLHVIYLTIREYNRIVSTESCVYHKHLNAIYHIKGLSINCLFV